MKFRNTIAAAALAACAGLAMAASAADLRRATHWGIAGSTGVVDEADFEVYQTTGPAMEIRADAPEEVTLNVRYNVSLKDAVADSTINPAMRIRDNGPDARVVVTFIARSLLDGQSRVLSIFDSDELEPSDEFQLLGTTGTTPTIGIAAEVYYFDVRISRTSRAGSPGLAGICFVGD